MKTSCKAISLLLTVSLVSVLIGGCNGKKDGNITPFTESIVSFSRGQGYTYKDTEGITHIYAEVNDFESDYHALTETLDVGIYSVMNREQYNQFYSTLPVNNLVPYSDKMIEAAVVVKGNLIDEQDYSIEIVAVQYETEKDAQDSFKERIARYDNLFSKYGAAVDNLTTTQKEINGINTYCISYSLKTDAQKGNVFFYGNYQYENYLLTYYGFDGAGIKNATNTANTLCTKLDLYNPV